MWYDRMKKGDIMRNYENEVRERFGDTEAYNEHKDKTKNYTDEKWSALADEMNAIFKEFADCKNSGAEVTSSEAQSLVAKLQNFISENYYSCTTEILKGLGQMYVLDERFKNNIDQHGTGTAEFVSKAIEIYCR